MVMMIIGDVHYV